MRIALEWKTQSLMQKPPWDTWRNSTWRMNIKSWDLIGTVFFMSSILNLKYCWSSQKVWSQPEEKIISSFFGFLGVLRPVLVKMKVLFETLCQEKFGSDAYIPRGSLETVVEVASGPARGAASISAAVCLCWCRGHFSWEYLLCGGVVGSWSKHEYHPVLLLSKTRVAPLSKQSIPSRVEAICPESC